MKPIVPQRLPLADIDWAAHIGLVGKANRGLARYDGILCGVPNPDVLLFTAHHTRDCSHLPHRRNS
jgi:hypothetical protein